MTRLKAQILQLTLIALATLLFWGYQIAHASGGHFAKNTRYDLCFSPNGHCERKILHLIHRAHKSLALQSYSFTSSKIANALIDAKQHGVNVRVIADRSLFDPANRHSRIQSLIHAGIPVWVDHRVNIQHNKVIVADSRWVETGSYNYTVSANRYNAENVLIIDSPTLAAQYFAYWQRRKLESAPATSYHYKKRRYRH